MVVCEGAIFGNLLIKGWGGRILVVIATIFYSLYHENRALYVIHTKVSSTRILTFLKPFFN